MSGILQRFSKWRDLKKSIVESVLKNDLSMVNSYSLFLESSHTTVIYFKAYEDYFRELHGGDIPGQQWIHEYFQSSVLVDHLLIQRWILHITNQQLRNLPNNIKKLNSLKKQLVYGLDDYFDASITYGSAQDIVNRGKIIMGLNDSYNSITKKVNNVEKLVEIEESTHRYKKDNFYKTGATIATILLALPATQQIIKIISDLEGLPKKIQFFNIIIDYIQRNQSTSTLILFLIIVLLLLGIPSLLSIKLLADKNKIVTFDQSKEAKKGGFIWPYLRKRDE
jgi:hypothetical protein